MGRKAENELVGLTVKRRSAVSLEEQIVRYFREEIARKRLQPGEKLPSSRALADILNVSRNTAKGALEQLLAEGYVTAIRGSGTQVANDLPDAALSIVGTLKAAPVTRPMSPVSKRAALLSRTPVTIPRRFNELRPFRAWLPAFDKFPLQQWAKLSAGRWRDASSGYLRYGGPQGLGQLRKAISEHLRACRGIEAAPEQIIVTAGSQAALFIAAQVLVDPGELILVENPGYLGARAAFTAAGARLGYVPVDTEGVLVSEAEKQSGARALYVTPSHQYPLGVTMSLPRRLEILQWAHSNESWILEDDYDTEFRYSGRPIPALFALDNGRRTIYAGSFSKVLAPSLRLGYLVLPSGLVEYFLRARSLIDRGSPSIDQAVLADFMDGGFFARHLREMRVLYAARQKALISSVTNYCGKALFVEPSPLGMHVVAWCKEGLESDDLAGEGARLGIDVVPLSEFYEGRCPYNAILLGFPALSERKIRDGAELLGKAVRRCPRKS